MDETIRPGTVFELTRNLESLPQSLKLRNVEWGLLFAVTGEHTVAQIGDHFGLAREERDRAFTRLLDAGLVSEREVNYAEYLRAAATIGDDEPKPLARFLRSGAALGPSGATDRSPKASAVRPAMPPESANLTRAIPTAEATRLLADASRTEAASVGFEPLKTPVVARPEVAPVVDERRLSLKALMRFILGRASDQNSGQLDIYRVFIRVNTKLLKRNGITTLSFEDDRLVSDPELQNAILSSVQRTLGLSCPQEIFV